MDNKRLALFRQILVKRMIANTSRKPNLVKDAGLSEEAIAKAVKEGMKEALSGLTTQDGKALKTRQENGVTPLGGA